MATVQLHVTQRGASASEAEARGHKLTMDRPQAKGGGDAGMMGGEALLSGLGGCFISNLLAAAKARDVALTDVKVLISAELEDAPSRFTEATMTVSAQYPSGTDFEKLVVLAERGCIAANTLKAAMRVKIVVA